MRQLPAVKDGLISALLYATLLLLPLTHRTVCPGAYEIPPSDVGLPLLALSPAPPSDDVDLDVGSQALSAPAPVPHFLFFFFAGRELRGGH